MNADNLGGFYNGVGTPPDASMFLNAICVGESSILTMGQLYSKLPYLRALFTEALEVLRLMAATSTSVPPEVLSMLIVMDWMEVAIHTSLWLDKSKQREPLSLVMETQRSLA